MMRLARSRLSFSKTEQNSNPCERAKLREVRVSLDSNTLLTISLCSMAEQATVWLLQMGDCPSKNEKLIEGKIH